MAWGIERLAKAIRSGLPACLAYDPVCCCPRDLCRLLLITASLYLGRSLAVSHASPPPLDTRKVKRSLLDKIEFAWQHLDPVVPVAGSLLHSGNSPVPSKLSRSHHVFFGRILGNLTRRYFINQFPGRRVVVVRSEDIKRCTRYFAPKRMFRMRDIRQPGCRNSLEGR